MRDDSSKLDRKTLEQLRIRAVCQVPRWDLSRLLQRSGEPGCVRHRPTRARKPPAWPARDRRRHHAPQPGRRLAKPEQIHPGHGGQRPGRSQSATGTVSSFRPVPAGPEQDNRARKTDWQRRRACRLTVKGPRSRPSWPGAGAPGGPPKCRARRGERLDLLYGQIRQRITYATITYAADRLRRPVWPAAAVNVMGRSAHTLGSHWHISPARRVGSRDWSSARGWPWEAWARRALRRVNRALAVISGIPLPRCRSRIFAPDVRTPWRSAHLPDLRTGRLDE